MIRIVLYSLTTLAALLGLGYGINQTVSHAGSVSDAGAEAFFRGTVVLFLSVIVLVLVHLAHRLARVFDSPAETPSPQRPVSDVSGTPWEKNPGFTNR